MVALLQITLIIQGIRDMTNDKKEHFVPLRKKLSDEYIKDIKRAISDTVFDMLFHNEDIEKNIVISVSYFHNGAFNHSSVATLFQNEVVFLNKEDKAKAIERFVEILDSLRKVAEDGERMLKYANGLGQIETEKLKELSKEIEQKIQDLKEKERDQ